MKKNKIKKHKLENRKYISAARKLVSYFPRQTLKNGIKFKVESDEYGWSDYIDLNEKILKYAKERNFTIENISYKDLDNKLMAIVLFKNKNNLKINEISKTEEYSIVRSELLILTEKRIARHRIKTSEEWSTFYNTYFLQTEYIVETFIKKLLQS